MSAQGVSDAIRDILAANPKLRALVRKLMAEEDDPGDTPAVEEEPQRREQGSDGRRYL
ncbi:MAG: hypothetical protein ABFE07_20645 [Armatimonadia bacterium]